MQCFLGQGLRHGSDHFEDYLLTCRHMNPAKDFSVSARLESPDGREFAGSRHIRWEIQKRRVIIFQA